MKHASSSTKSLKHA